ncbi:hypothetical protein TNCV_3590901 [Trichonephila clavipes]|nr:hypothetical protein TNCV_3590901 [Trichonephila clavipes]
MAPRLQRRTGADHITARVTNEGRKVRFGYLSFRTYHTLRVQITSESPMPQLYYWEANVLLQAVILARDKGGVETSWRNAGGTDAGMAIGNAGAQMLVKLLELERPLELDHVSALV